MHYKFLHAIAICLLLMIVSCEKAKDLKPPDLSPQPVVTPDMSLAVSTNNAAADGVQFNEYFFKLNNVSSFSSREVAFDISPYGKFSNGSTTQRVTIDNNGEARVYAISPTAGIATIRAAFAGYSKQVPSQFSIAWPEQILVEPDSVFLPAAAGMKTNLTLKLIRATGTVSTGIVVQLSDSTVVASPASVGIFLNSSLSNASGIMTAEYWLQNTSYHNYVYLNAAVTTPAGIIRGRNRILIRN